MIKIIGTRGSGKTTKLLELANRERYCLIEPNARMADYARRIAKENGYKVQVISVQEWLILYKRGVNPLRCLVDELDLCLDYFGIKGYSNESDEKDEERLKIKSNGPANTALKFMTLTESKGEISNEDHSR